MKTLTHWRVTYCRLSFGTALSPSRTRTQRLKSCEHPLSSKSGPPGPRTSDGQRTFQITWIWVTITWPSSRCDTMLQHNVLVLKWDCAVNKPHLCSSKRGIQMGWARKLQQMLYTILQIVIWSINYTLIYIVWKHKESALRKLKFTTWLQWGIRR